MCFTGSTSTWTSLPRTGSSTRAAGVVTTINPAYTAREVNAQLLDSGATRLAVTAAGLEQGILAAIGTRVIEIVVVGGDAVAIAAAPEDGDEASGRERPRRLEQVTQGVVGVGVVDEDVEGLANVHPLGAAGHAGEPSRGQQRRGRRAQARVCEFSSLAFSLRPI